MTQLKPNQKETNIMYCKECGNEITENRIVCPNCGATLKDRKSTTSAIILSMIVPGLGQFYNGQNIKGIYLWTGCLIAMAISPILAIVVWGIGILDAYSVANNTQPKNPAEKNTSIGITFVKAFLGALAILFGITLIGGIIFWMGSDVTEISTATVSTVQTPEPAQDPEVKDRITTKFDGQEKHVKCKVLIVPTNGGTIYIENDDIEVISVIGNGNMIAYPSSANPEIRDVGSYNEIWGSIWL